jgi:hypothetical protein
MAHSTQPSRFTAPSLIHPRRSALERLAAEIARVVRGGGVWLVEVPSPAWLDGLDALPVPTEQRITRTGARTCIIEDAVVREAIEARVYTDAEWRDALGPWWTTTVEKYGAYEWLIVAHRNTSAGAPPQPAR